MALDLATALNQYGFVGQLANSIPELRTIFAQAAREEWDPARFERSVMDTKWWKTHSDSARQLITERTVDPASFRQKMTNAAQKVALIAASMGRTANANRVAELALYGFWDDEQIRTYIGRTGALVRDSGGFYSGDAAELRTHLTQVAANYGVPITDAYLNQMVTAVQRGGNTLEAYETTMRARAKAAFPQFADQLDSGLTVRDIADPYISTMASTLEVSETELDLRDTWVKKALSSKQADGTMGSMPLWQFERQLKDDPRWDRTKQAREAAFETVAQIGRDFGFEAS